MKLLRSLLGVSLTLGIVSAYMDDYNLEEDRTCWQKCFEVADCGEWGHLKPAYNDILQAALDVQRLVLIYNINSTAFLMDSTLSPHHALRHEMPNSEYSGKIWKFQKDLAGIIATVMNDPTGFFHNQIWLSQFDEDKAWSCPAWSCLNSCDAMYAMEYMECPHTTESSYRDGNIEPACRVTEAMMSYRNDFPRRGQYCYAYKHDSMAIAFVNSDFDHKVRDVHHEHGDHQAFSACQSFYSTRVVVGTHVVDEDEMDSFQSPSAHRIYIRDNPYTFEAAHRIRDCIRARCCATWALDNAPYKYYPDYSGYCFSMTEDYNTKYSRHMIDYVGQTTHELLGQYYS